jgi:hypothetical protein
MTEATAHHDDPTDDRDGREAQARATRDADRPPVAADQFPIADLQHWIDLCA